MDDFASFPNKTPFQCEYLQLFYAQQYKSAEILARMDVQDEHFRLAVLAECAYQQRKFVQAKDYYRKLHRYDPCKYACKEAACLQALDSPIEALSVLEALPKRNWRVNIRLGDLCLTNSKKKQAKSAYRAALEENPYAVEVIERLANLGDDKASVQACVQTGLGVRGTMGKDDVLMQLVQALTAKYEFQSATALQSLEELCDQFPGHTYLMLQMAHLRLHNDQIARAELLFSQIRQQEPAWVTDMDQYAHLLAREERLSDLLELSETLLNVDDRAAEAWNAAAIYFEVTEEHAKAVQFVDKAVSLDQRHAFSFRLKGSMNLTEGRPEHASVAFFRSNILEVNLSNYEGLVDSYIAANKPKEAIASAKEAIKLAPRDGRAVTLVGLALAQGNAPNAKRTLLKALDMNPSALRPLFCLVDLYIRDSEMNAAIEVLAAALQGSTESYGQDHILNRLGEVCILQESYAEAISYFHQALGLTPNMAEATRNMERLEKLMKGQDPDDESEMEE